MLLSFGIDVKYLNVLMVIYLQVISIRLNGFACCVRAKRQRLLFKLRRCGAYQIRNDLL